ncbi:MAG: Holliday junction branch migration protein RuvA [candidate division WOR-3 bacterium]|nr:Holliday junction branch migration protein RuvA [candidate division WOR-3 bacterium]MCX7757192.1 Holliday junction branch migration protein RuvA [candidate division WOR-3 bacterium]MDW7987923.1 Holliday junction branch migration protein RuvA [candidate division WOR-3 bacterium]
MIATLTGKVISKTPTSIVVDCSGIGFLVYVPVLLSQNIEIDQQIKLLIQPVFSHKKIEFYGFATAEEKDIFNTIISVKGVGARVGLNLLCRLSPQEIKTAIETKNLQIFKTIPGIGPKKAERIIFYLKKSSEESARIPENYREIYQALNNLGFSRKEINERLARIPDWTKKSLTEVIQLVLKQR